MPNARLNSLALLGQKQTILLTNALKRDPKQVLGVTIKRVQGSRDFVKHPDLQVFTSFISLTVNPPAKE